MTSSEHAELLGVAAGDHAIVNGGDDAIVADDGDHAMVTDGDHAMVADDGDHAMVTDDGHVMVTDDGHVMVTDGDHAMVTDGDTVPASMWRRRVMLIPALIGALAGLLGGLALSLTTNAGYESTGTAFVVFSFPPEEPDPFSGSQFVRQRIESYAQLGQSPEVLQAVADDVGGRTAADLAGHVTVAAVPGTVLLRVTVQDSDQMTAVKIANSVMSNLDEAVVAVESGGPGAVSPIGLVPVQPAISGPAATTFGEVVKPIASAVIGTLLGIAFGWMLARRTPRDSGPDDAQPSESPGKHRERTSADLEPQLLPQLALSLDTDTDTDTDTEADTDTDTDTDARPKQAMNAL